MQAFAEVTSMDTTSSSRRLAGTEGFSLAELAVAILILTVALVGMAGLMASSSTLQNRTTSRIEMSELAMSRLEELRAAASSATADTVELALGGSLTASQANHADTVTTAKGRQYVRRWLVEAGPAQARQVTLRILPAAQSINTIPWLDFLTYILIL